MDNGKKNNPSFRISITTLTFMKSFTYSTNTYGVLSVPRTLCSLEGKLRAVRSRAGSHQGRANERARGAMKNQSTLSTDRQGLCTLGKLTKALRFHSWYLEVSQLESV